MGTTSEINFIVHNQVEGADGIVMNERTDILQMGDNRVELPVMGVFELQGGKISAWRDYFDMASFALVGVWALQINRGGRRDGFATVFCPR